jgi:hypothetical protein
VIATTSSRDRACTELVALGLAWTVTAQLLGMLGEAQPAEGKLPPGHPFLQVEGGCGKAKALARPLLVDIYIHGGRPRATLALLSGVSMIGQMPN